MVFLKMDCVTRHCRSGLVSLFLCLLIGLSTVCPAHAALTLHPVPSGASASDRFSVTAQNGGGQQSVFVYRFNSQNNLPHHLCTFDMSGSVTIRVKKLGGNINSAVIRPQSLNISRTISGDTLTFTISSPRNLCIELDGDRNYPLYLFANPIETDAPAPGTAGIRYFAAGFHDLDNEYIGQDTYLAPGAIVRGMRFNGRKLWGRGILAGNLSTGKQSQIWTSAYNLDIKDIIMVRPLPGWMFVLDHADTGTIRNVRILADEPTDDGIDMISANNITVDGAFIRVRDDCIAIKNYNADWSQNPPYYPGSNTSNITIKNSIMYNGVWGNNLEVGVEMIGGYVNGVTFQNLDLIHGMSDLQAPYDAALSIHNAGDTAISNVTYDNIRVENLDPNQCLIQALVWESPIYTFGRPRGTISGLTYKNISYTGTSKPIILLQGSGPNHQISNVTFDNVTLNGVLLEHPNPTVANFIFADNVTGVKFGANASTTYSSAGSGWAVRSYLADRVSYFATDGDLNTHWHSREGQSGGTMADWIAFNLSYKTGNAASFDKIVIDYPWWGFMPGYSLSFSSDGVNWGGTIQPGSVTHEYDAEGYERSAILTFPRQTAKYVRISPTANHPWGNPFQFKEVSFFDGSTKLNLSVNPPTQNPVQQTPYNGPHNLPKTIQAEDFDNGGSGVAYSDTSSANEGNALGNTYRTSEQVDLEPCADTGGGTNVGWTVAGEWLEYTVVVPSGGATYNVRFRVASQPGGGTFHLENGGGTNLTGAMTVNATGGWQSWTNLTKNGVTLSGGTHVLRFVVDSGNFNLNYIEFTTASSQVTAPAFSPVPGTYSSAQTVTISTTTSGATIRYTTNGTNPTPSAGTVYSGPVAISSTTTLKAIAYKSGMTNSAVTSGTYTINTVSGSLSGSGASFNGSSSTNLTSAGTLDWAHWGRTGTTDFNHKSSGGTRISNVTKLGSASLGQNGDNDPAFSWTDGTPTGSANNVMGGIFVGSQNGGFQFTVPADTTQRVLKVYVYGWYGQGKLTATLSDGSAPAFVSNQAWSTRADALFAVCYTLTYKAASAGKTLTVQWILDRDDGDGAVGIQAATLQ